MRLDPKELAELANETAPLESQNARVSQQLGERMDDAQMMEPQEMGFGRQLKVTMLWERELMAGH